MSLHAILALALAAPSNPTSVERMCQHVVGLLPEVDPTECENEYYRYFKAYPEIEEEVVDCVMAANRTADVANCLTDRVLLEVGILHSGQFDDRSIEALISKSPAEMRYDGYAVRGDFSGVCDFVFIENFDDGTTSKLACADIASIGGPTGRLIASYAEMEASLDAVLAGQKQQKDWPRVRLTQAKGAEPIDLYWVDPVNGDRRQRVTLPGPDFRIEPGTYVFDGDDYRPSRKFSLQAGRDYNVTVKPRSYTRARVGGLVLGLGLPLLAIIPLVIPFKVDMPKEQAIGWWAGAGVLAGAGVVGGLALRFGRSRVELATVPRLGAEP